MVQPPFDGYPQCTIEGGKTSLYAGDKMSLLCVSKGGVPPAKLTWHHDGEASENMVHYGNNMGQVRYLTYAMPSHDGSTFVCTAESMALRGRLRNCTIGPMTIQSPLALVSSLESNEPVGLTENYAILDADEMVVSQGITFTCGLKTNLTSEDVQNTTWSVNGRVVSGDTKDFGITDEGQTLFLKEDSLIKGEVEVSCHVNVNGVSLGNITRLVEIAGLAESDEDANPGSNGMPDHPIIYKTNDNGTTNVIDIRPLILLNACVILIMILLILVAVYSPKVCNCRSPVYQQPMELKLAKQSSRRHADSRITELHFVQSEQCQNGVALCEGPHFYETPDGAGPNHQSSCTLTNSAPPLPPNHVHSSQEMKATFHVVVHSRNGGPISQTTHQVTNETSSVPHTPPLATVSPLNNTSNTSNNNSGSVCCVYAPVRKKSKGNVYTEDKANLQPHYQRVTGPPRIAEHLLSASLPSPSNLHENPLTNDQVMNRELHSLTTSPCSTLPSNSKLTNQSMSYSRTLPPTPLELKESINRSISCGDISEDDLDSIYANIASLEDIFKQTSL